MSPPAPNPTLLELLKGVSRSFYLSVRILPGPMRKPVTVAYLLARAADTLSDTEILAAERRVHMLKQFRDLLAENPSPADPFFATLHTEIGQHEHGMERSLMTHLSRVVVAFTELPEPIRLITRNVLLTLTQGMMEDLTFFQDKSLRCLQRMEDTERYTYLVAGCVGEFWTDLLILLGYCPWSRETMMPIGVRFGQGLQMVNILRDLPKDLAQGRSYLAKEDLERFQVRLQRQDSDSLTGWEALFAEKIGLARCWLRQGQEYAQAIPRRRIRLRLAVLWPLWIGLATLRGIEKQTARERFEQPFRIPRRQVYRFLLGGVFIAPSNRLLRWTYQRNGGVR